MNGFLALALKFPKGSPLTPSQNLGDRDVSKIGGYENRPVQLGTEKAVSRTNDAGARPAPGKGTGSPVHITNQARQLATLEQAVQGAPIVDEARVAGIRHAIETGRYEVSPQRIADKLLRLEQDLKTAEN